MSKTKQIKRAVSYSYLQVVKSSLKAFNAPCKQQTHSAAKPRKSQNNNSVYSSLSSALRPVPIIGAPGADIRAVPINGSLRYSRVIGMGWGGGGGVGAIDPTSIQLEIS